MDEVKYLNKRLKNSKLFIRITRPTNIGLLEFIKDSVKDDDTIELKMDYHDLGMEKLIKTDVKTLDIGMLIMTNETLNNRKKVKHILDLRLPIFKLGDELQASIKRTVILLNDINSYEQISPVIFDVASQFKTKTKIFDMDPVGEHKDKTNLLDHFENLSKIFNQKIEVISNDKNPIRELRKQESILQILPLKEGMLRNRFSWKFLYTNPDFLSFDMKKFNQLLVPIVEE